VSKISLPITAPASNATEKPLYSFLDFPPVVSQTVTS
jgi:hypothetical protein